MVDQLEIIEGWDRWKTSEGPSQRAVLWHMHDVAACAGITGGCNMLKTCYGAGNSHKARLNLQWGVCITQGDRAWRIGKA